MCFFRRKNKKVEKSEVVVEQKVAQDVVREEEKQSEPELEKAKPIPKQETNKVVMETTKKPQATTKTEKAKETPKEEDIEDKVEPEKFAYHITQVKNEKSEFYKMWRVRRSGSNKVIKHFKTQKEAIAEAKRYAEANEGASIVIHRVDGKIRKQKY